MIRKLLVLPVIYVLSRIVAVVARAGELINPNPVFTWLFDWMIGWETAEQMRDDHKDALVEAVAARDIQYGGSKQVLIEESQNLHRESLSNISRGESLFTISIALIAALGTELPETATILFGLQIPLPSVNALLLILTVILVASVFLRETAIQSQAFKSPSVFDSYEELIVKVAWNGGTLSQTRLMSNLLLVQILRETDEDLYQLYLDFIAEYIAKDGISRQETVVRFVSYAYKIVLRKWNI